MSSAEVNAGPRQAPSLGSPFLVTGPRRPGFLSRGASEVPMEMARPASPSAQPCLLPRLLQALGTRPPLSSWPACQPPPRSASQRILVLPALPSFSGAFSAQSFSSSHLQALWPWSLHVDTSSLGGSLTRRAQLFFT